MRLFSGPVLRLCMAGLVAIAGLCGAETGMAQTPASSLPITATVIDSFETGSQKRDFGAFTFIGGLALSSPDPLFGAWSGIRFRPDGKSFIGVLDTGHWLSGTITRDAEGRLSGIADASLVPMIDRRGNSEAGKQSMDAEGLALADGEVLVSYEQRHRVDAYPDPGFATTGPIRTLPLPFPSRQLLANGGLEALAMSPRDSALQGSPVVIAERSITANGNLPAGILTGPLKGAFSVKHTDEFDVSDGTFLPDGDMLVLERRFTWAKGLGIRVRLLKAADIKPGNVADGAIVFQSEFGDQIDNMEGIDALTGPDGTTHVILVSDDNHSLLQRTLMLEFRFNGH